MSAEVHDVLVKTRALIADPERWTKFAFAKNDEGLEVPPLSPVACKWCASGALQACSQSAGFRISMPEYTALMEALSEGYKTVASFNDAYATTHADVLALFDRAIKATKP